MEEITGLLNNTSLPDNLPSDGVKGILGYTCCYIVGAVILQPPNKVLLIQEAKPSCRGQWYLPAGRLERNETLVEGVQREVEEESGYKFHPTSIICVEGNGPGWLRVSFSGNITGGELKTHEDAESIQAQWFEVAEVLNNRVNLRCQDIIHVILKAVKMSTTHSILPISVPRPNFTVTLLLIAPSTNSEECCLVTTEDGVLPHQTSLHRGASWTDMTYRLLEDIGCKRPECRPCGLVNIGHDGRQGQDGLHATLGFTTPHKTPLRKGWKWQTLGTSITEHFNSDKMISYDWK